MKGARLYLPHPLPVTIANQETTSARLFVNHEVPAINVNKETT